MPKPNYAFEKRQREIAKKKEKDAKQSRKRAAREEPQAASGSGEGPQAGHTKHVQERR